jgi:chemotaxis family two-component system sensor kinase Cph1
MTESETTLPENSTTPLVDLDNCAQEPIRIPGSIQPRGILLAVREIDFTVIQTSANLTELIDAPATTALGKPLADVLGPVVAANIRRATEAFGDLGERNPLDVKLEVDGKSLQFDAILHRAPGGTLLIELEIAVGPRPFSFPNTFLAVRSAVADLNRAASLPDLYDITAHAVQQLTGFDRVMVYRFDEEFNGEVVAEVKRDHLEPFLGLHFPESDIPAQARALYEQNWIRLIADVGYKPVPILPALNPDTGAPLDLSLSTLRSVSPIHIEYLQNMGTSASMSISLLRHGVLWGLIACHHYGGPLVPPYGVRAAAEFLGLTLSLRLIDRADEADLRARLASQEMLTSITAAIHINDEPLTRSLLTSPSLLDLIPADGVAISAEGQTVTYGRVPDADAIAAIAEWVRSTGHDLVATDSLSASSTQFDVPPELASGVLGMALPEGQYLLWFRREAIQAVDWSGDPRTKMTVPTDGIGVRLSPRKSFDRWREVVRLRSEPWTERERELASELRRHTVELLYSRSQRDLRLAEMLQRSLLPDRLPEIPGWVVSAHYEPAERGNVGGDWYDAFTVGDGRLAVVLGDVAGHGLTAAGTMAQLRNVLRGHLFHTSSPVEALSRLNEFIEVLLPNSFATAFVACIDPISGHVTAASAGQLPPLIISHGPYALQQAPVHVSPPLCISGAQFISNEFDLEPGSGLVLYSDGLVERRGEALDQSIDRFARTLGSIDPLAEARAIFSLAAQTQSFDDATVLAIWRQPMLA